MFFLLIVQVVVTGLPDAATDIDFSPGEFVQIKSSIKNQEEKEEKKESEEDIGNDSKDGDEDKEEFNLLVKNNALFSCPSDTCICTFQKHSSLEYHILYGKCKLLKEKNTLLDQAKLLYVQKLSEGISTQPIISGTSTDVQSAEQLLQGWALKQSKKNARFNDNQKAYPDERFKIGQATGIKADPLQVSRDFCHARNENGDRRFTINEYLSPQQIRSYFSRTAKKNKSLAEEEVVEDEESVEEERAYCLAHQNILEECELTHHIMCDTYNICQLYGSEKLGKLTVKILRHFCRYFNMDGVESLSDRRKAPYLSFLGNLVQSCTCCNRC